ncbi:MAG: rhamnulose-1-phosphate aldolase [Chitinophagaceae bacterium]
MKLLETLYEELSEIAGYLWERGWAELNAGNISIRLTEVTASTFKDLAVSEPIVLPEPVPALKNQFVLITGTGRRMRQIAKQPKEHTLIVGLNEEGSAYKIYYTSFTKNVNPTSELPTHLACHSLLLESKPHCTTILHTHPNELVSFSHHPDMVNEEIVNQTLWKMHPETVVAAIDGMGFIPYQIPGNKIIAEATFKKLATKDIIFWQKHGIFAVSHSLKQAFDVIDVLNKAAIMYLQCKAAGYEPTGLSHDEIEDLKYVYRDFSKRFV